MSPPPALSPADLDAIEALREKATQGPAITIGSPPRGISIGSATDIRMGHAAGDVHLPPVEIELLVALRNAAPALLAELRALRKVRDAARLCVQAVDEAHAQAPDHELIFEVDYTDLRAALAALPEEV